MADRPYHIFVLEIDGTVEHSTQPKAPDYMQWQRWHRVCQIIPCFKSFTFEGVKYSRGTALADENGITNHQPLNRPATKAWAANFKPGQGPDYYLLGRVIFYAKEPKVRAQTGVA